MLGITAIAQSPIASLGGTNASVEVTGIALTTTTGSVSITAIQNPTIQLTSVTASTTLGAIQVDPDVIVTGEQLTTVIGPYSVQADATTTIIAGSEKELETSVGTVTLISAVDAPVTGTPMTSAVGDVDATFTVLVSGIDMTATPGDLDISGTATVSLSTNLLTISDSSPTVIIDVTVEPTGINLTTALNSTTVALNTPVDLTGFAMTITEGTPGTVAWSDVDPNVSNTWTEVDIAA